MNGLDNQQCNDEGLRELALFAGAGGGILGGHLLGWRTVCAVEYNAYARSVLLARQNDGTLPPFPVWDDVRTFDGKPWRGLVDVVSGGFPCQDISVAGKGAGLDGERSGLWGEQKRIVCEVEPSFVFVENSPALTIRGLGIVLGDLASLGFNAKWGVLSCADVGGVHLRERIWIVAAHPLRIRYISKETSRKISHLQKRVAKACKCGRCEIPNASFSSFEIADTGGERGERLKQKEIYRFTRFPWGEDVRGLEELRNRSDIPEPLIRRIGDDVAFGVDRLKAIGNGQISRVAATAWRILNDS